MKNLIVQLADVADYLDQKGLTVEADAIDSLIAEASDRKFDIFVKGKVHVKRDVLAKLGDMQEPGDADQLKAEATLVVRPVENGQVLENSPVFTKQFAAKNLTQLKAAYAQDVAQLRVTHAPASFDEQFEYVPA